MFYKCQLGAENAGFWIIQFGKLLNTIEGAWVQTHAEPDLFFIRTKTVTRCLFNQTILLSLS